METAIVIFAWLGLGMSAVVAILVFAVAVVWAWQSLIYYVARATGSWGFIRFAYGLFDCPRDNPHWMGRQLKSRFEQFKQERPESAKEFLRLITPANESE